MSKWSRIKNYHDAESEAHILNNFLDEKLRDGASSLHFRPNTKALESFCRVLDTQNHILICLNQDGRSKFEISPRFEWALISRLSQQKQSDSSIQDSNHQNETLLIEAVTFQNFSLLWFHGLVTSM